MKGITNILLFVILWAILVVVTLGLAAIALIILLLLTHAGADAREEKASLLLAGTPMPGETVTVQGLQRRAFALFKRRLLLAISTSRIILIRRGLIGGFKIQDIQWKDLTDARIEQNVWSSLCGSNLAFQHANAAIGSMDVDGIASDTASTIYANAQFEEQAWEEKRRVRAIEETRAASGGVVVHAAAPTATLAPAVPTAPLPARAATGCSIR